MRWRCGSVLRSAKYISYHLHSPHLGGRFTSLNMKLDMLIKNTIGCNHQETLALGYMRYEVIRKLSPRHFTELHQRNLKGENFDDMVTELIAAQEVKP